ncbi:hypothetical protein M3M38_06570 [Fructilactobacillus cliffordii]|uniref:hypothetical protein n=1 Tax=Fructilactobacillus cliffordii TaxID=2940299 RepID=UPI002091F381|nr:hypothetical protein [Fructilactobacillus cliffordii]USS86346.1 hypothetical protein M3M38_06570 [Fructilactobacillus cliffordii]
MKDFITNIIYLIFPIAVQEIFSLIINRGRRSDLFKSNSIFNLKKSNTTLAPWAGKHRKTAKWITNIMVGFLIISILIVDFYAIYSYKGNSILFVVTILLISVLSIIYIYTDTKKLKMIIEDKIKFPVFKDSLGKSYVIFSKYNDLYIGQEERKYYNYSDDGFILIKLSGIYDFELKTATIVLQ